MRKGRCPFCHERFGKCLAMAHLEICVEYRKHRAVIQARADSPEEQPHEPWLVQGGLPGLGKRR
jgi:hypothetical protein